MLALIQMQKVVRRSEKLGKEVIETVSDENSQIQEDQILDTYLVLLITLFSRFVLEDIGKESINLLKKNLSNL